ncbi:hypothetical protein A2801_04455 [Candidatus Woesebacteria bacterium RIFCSPHIGHO2_01_FULL_41_10]|uniref:Uncharacterized protein n=1 Tax=Candidatus Woesebacteria bacterium RIFCSPHIGHO2_01_FULL_41_10 TaxID=1802500 RepID=A0A1F7YLM1_9BACT|nr:MAG: hypothetical protein A2801_04455 [Candidatus Woesebacteria bacterium RIFCSPHIGHO2_01_FULL_41_10]
MKFKILGVLSIVFAISLLVTCGSTLFSQNGLGDLYSELGTNPDFTLRTYVNIGLVVISVLNAFLGFRVFQSENDGFFNVVFAILTVSFIGSGLALWYVNSLAYASVQEVLSGSTGI